jgi:hypothetical protein
MEAVQVKKLVGGVVIAWMVLTISGGGSAATSGRNYIRVFANAKTLGAYHCLTKVPCPGSLVRLKVPPITGIAKPCSVVLTVTFQYRTSAGVSVAIGFVTGNLETRKTILRPSPRFATETVRFVYPSTDWSHVQLYSTLWRALSPGSGYGDIWTRQVLITAEAAD